MSSSTTRTDEKETVPVLTELFQSTLYPQPSLIIDISENVFAVNWNS